MKNLILSILESQVKRYLAKYQPKIIAITGSVGKTSTKIFTATVLSQKFKVMSQYGNHNTEVSVPFAIFEEPLPTQLKNPFTWIKTLWRIEQKLKQPFPYDIILLELGTDHPGDIARFSRYLQPDISVVTSVAPEHMEFFKTLDAVAQEELAVANFSKYTLINRDDIDAKYAEYVTVDTISTYGMSGVAEYHYLIEDFHIDIGFKGKLVSPEFGAQPANLKLVGEHTIKAAVAAAAIGIKLGMTMQEVATGMAQIQPVSGRMRLFRGLNESVLLDDSYNSSPVAVKAALQTLYAFPAKHKIAILGSMNELGEHSKAAHQEAGALCDGTMLDWVVTIGAEAEQYLAPAAANKGCQVRSFTNPYDAGSFVHSVLQPDTVVLVKGSQNGVFSEEALKILLHDTEDEHQLVRQEPEWLAKKQATLPKPTLHTSEAPVSS